MIQNRKRLSTYMERFVGNSESRTTSHPVYGGRYFLLFDMQHSVMSRFIRTTSLLILTPVGYIVSLPSCSVMSQN